MLNTQFQLNLRPLNGVSEPQVTHSELKKPLLNQIIHLTSLEFRYGNISCLSKDKGLENTQVSPGESKK